MLVVAWYLEAPSGWVIWDAEAGRVVSGPYDTPEDAEEAIKTRAYRLAQGWEP